MFDVNYPDLDEYSTGLELNSIQSQLLNGCILSKGNHRIIITPSQANLGSYLLFSCVLNNTSTCTFEE